MEAQSKTPSQESSFPLISPAYYIRMHGCFFHIFISFFFPSSYPSQCPGNIYYMSLFLFDAIACFPHLSQINFSVMYEWDFFLSISFC